MKYFDLKQKKLLEIENEFFEVKLRKNKEDVAQIDQFN